MKTKHPQIPLPDEPESQTVISTNRRIDIMFDKANSEAPISQPHHFTRQVLLEALIQLIITCNLSFAIIEQPAFLAFAKCLNRNALQYLPQSARTIPRLLGTSLAYYRLSLVHKLQESQSLIHLSVDVWTSTNRRSYLAIIAHWVYQWKRQKALLRLPRLKGSHSGETQAQHIFQVLSEYSIARRLGYITSDNASSNGTLVVRLSEILYSQIKKRWDPIWHRLRCTGHIINLSLQAFLFASNKKAWKEVTRSALQNEDLDLAVQLIQQDIREKGKKNVRLGPNVKESDIESAGWRAVGPLGTYSYI